MIKELRVAGSLTVLLALAGCSSFNQLLGREEAIDYQSSSPVTGGLAVPPDLTQVANNPQFQIPGSTTYSQYASAQAQRDAIQARDSGRVLPQYDDIRVGRDGMNRWLVVEGRSADALFDETVDFWRGMGFAIETEDPASGLIETDWAENRANIPQDLLRSLLGRVIDMAYDSGTRERFRTRFERTSDGAIEIYITHQALAEERISDTRAVWVEGNPDPELDAAMINRLMVYLGASEAQARAAVAEASTTPVTPVELTQVATGSGAQGALQIQEPFDRSWRRVGLALDRGHFTVEDRDRSRGQYFVRYVDIDAAVMNEDPSFLARMFSRNRSSQPSEQYRVQLRETAGTTQVTVLDAEGNPATGETPGRILDVLLEQLQN